jgi:heme oxygenase
MSTKYIMQAQTLSSIASPKPSAIMLRLKNDTLDSHKQLEKTSSLKRIFCNDFSIEEYADLTAFFFGFFSSIEPLIYNNLPTESDCVLQHRRKTALLQQDLINLGLDEQAIACLPVCKDVPSLNSFAQRMGALYVLEGSTLGGRMISKHLKNHFGDSILPVLNFYGCYGESSPVEWQNFSKFMSECFDNENTDTDKTVIDAAIETFSSLYQWLEACDLHAKT